MITVKRQLEICRSFVIGAVFGLVVAACAMQSNEPPAAPSSPAYPTAPSPASVPSAPSPSSGSSAPAEAGSRQQAGASQSDSGALEEITVTGSRVERSSGNPVRDRLERRAHSAPATRSDANAIRSFANASAGAGVAREADEDPLLRVSSGEEVWIISRPAAPAADARDDDSPGTGAMVASLPRRNAEPETVPLPLDHTSVRAALSGYVGTVDVTQQFENPFDEKIEAVYLFPLPEKSAVSEFVMTIGDRRIRGILREREEAEEIYAEARAQGYQASLLTQQRPNIFEQKVANIEPGKRIDVNIRYYQTLAFHDGWYSFVFPTIVGPRYNPPGSADPVLALPRQDTTRTDNAAVRYLRPNERSGHDLSIAVDLDAGVDIEELHASHRVVETRTGPTTAHIELASQSTLPNKDFVLDFRVAGETLKSNLLTYVDDETGEGYFTFMLYPPAAIDSLERQPLELVFVLDCSGSMSGEPIGQAKDAIIAAVDRLTPDDTFQIIRFSNNASQLGPVPLRATPENRRAAREYVRGLSGSGGTQMIEGIKAALDFPHDPERLRFVTFLTDGYIGNEAEILGAIQRRLGESRIFSFGVGSSVNRYLLERMAGLGRGTVAYLGLEDSGREVMDLFFDRVSHPALIDVGIDWGDMRVSDVYPSELPDLFVGRPVIVTGKFTGEPGDARVRGRAAGRALDYRIPYATDVSNEATNHAFLPNLWARLRIAELNDRLTSTADRNGALAGQIRDTALRYGLMSDYTAFIAVDASRVTSGDHGTTVFQAVPVPEGVRYETAVAR